MFENKKLFDSSVPGRIGRVVKRDIIKQVIFSVAVLVAVIALCAGIWYYIDTSSIYAKCRLQQDEISRLKAGIEKRDSQLRLLSLRLDKLNQKMGELSALESKIRSIAGMAPEKHVEFSGIGGEVTDAIDPVESARVKYDDIARYLNSQIDKIQIMSSIRSEKLEKLLDILETERAILMSMPSISPVDGGSVTSGFGFRKSPFTGKHEFHQGVDIADKIGTPVKATAAGVVTCAERRGSFGNLVVIDHGHGLVSLYGHLNEIEVEPGQRVAKGQVIGKLGSTGRSTGPHLHYEIRFNGIPMDPERYLPDYVAKR